MRLRGNRGKERRLSEQCVKEKLDECEKQWSASAMVVEGIEDREEVNVGKVKMITKTTRCLRPKEAEGKNDSSGDAAATHYPRFGKAHYCLGSVLGRNHSCLYNEPRHNHLFSCQTFN
jgi:hypothetical protein